MFTVEEKVLTVLLRKVCCNDTVNSQELAEAVRKAAGTRGMTTELWEHVIELADMHNVLSLCYDVLRILHGIPQHCRKLYEKKSRQVVYRNYRLLFLTRFVVSLLKENGIQVLVLKGASTALLYPVPELRKSGDVDLLLNGQHDLLKACTLLENHGFVVRERQAALHHVALSSGEGIMVELHGMMAEPFDNNKMNLYLEKLIPQMMQTFVLQHNWGIPIPAPAPEYHAYYLLIHMLQHFLRYGFGMKYLCDWVMFWKQNTEPLQKDKFLELVTDSKILGFARMITAVCVEYLGLEEEKVSFLETQMITGDQRSRLLKEILEAGEFGKAQKDRMVVLRENGMKGYLREFHHQMCLNFPKYNKIFLLWPILWGITFYRFWQNNRKLRKIPGTAILRKAAKRGKLVRQMELFK